MNSLRKLIEVSWMSSTQNTDVLSTWTTNYVWTTNYGRGLPTMFVHHAFGSDNERRKNPHKYFL